MPSPKSPAMKAYIRKTVQFIGKRDPLKLMASTPARIERAVRGLTAAQFKRRPGRGKWSIQEILGHLADTEVVYGWRIRRALAEPGAPVHGFDQQRWAECFRYQRTHARASLAVYRLVRLTTLAAIAAAPRPARKRAAVMHSERGREPFLLMCKMCAGHDLNHLAQVLAVRKKFGWGARKAR
ncbi:MAG TPA: DinB family protein [Candidatus Saccharimonadales bacterium]|nr:DinB family protein [Candidatus Saccharimonadales bacterium]